MRTVQDGIAVMPRHPARAAAALFTSSDPLVSNTAVMLLMATLSWIFFLATNNCSHVDRLWSILPAVYVTVFARDALTAFATTARYRGVAPALQGAAQNGDMVLLWSVVVTGAWAVRLTYNFYRKGGYRLSSEDYRCVVKPAATTSGRRSKPPRPSGSGADVCFARPCRLACSPGGGHQWRGRGEAKGRAVSMYSTVQHWCITCHSECHPPSVNP